MVLVFDFYLGYGDNNCYSKDCEQYNEDDVCFVNEIVQILEEVVDGVVVGVESYVFFLCEWEDVVVEFVVVIGFVEFFMYEVERDCNGFFGYVLYFVEIGQVVVEFFDIFDEVFGVKIEVFQFINGFGEVDSWNVGYEVVKYGVFDIFGDVVDFIF